MRVGDLRHRIDIEAPTDVADGMGGMTRTFSAVAKNVPAAVWPTSVSERLQAGQQAMTISHRVRIRWRDGLLAGYRVAFGSRYFAIVGMVTPNEVRRMIDLLCAELRP